MLIDRRTLLQGAAVLAVIDLLSLSSKVLAQTSQVSGPLPTHLVLAESATQHVLKIDGWERRDNLPTEPSQPSPSYAAVDQSADDEVFIKINGAWRTAWR